MYIIDIKGLDKAKVLQVLYNNAKPLGLGFLHYDPADDMTYAQAKELIDSKWYDFDYLKGRVMKVNIEKDSFNPRLYDRDNGTGAAEKAIDSIRGQYGN